MAALHTFTTAHILAEEVRSDLERARALDGSGRAHHHLGDPEAAIQALQFALNPYRGLAPGLDDTADLLARLRTDHQ